MENCVECNKEYDPNNMTIPSPIPDGMCAVCGNELSEEEQNQVMANLGIPDLPINSEDDTDITPLIDIAPSEN